MSDPKYTPKNGGIYHENGYRLPDDEPLMILRGKDIGALGAICDYIEMLIEQPMNKVIHSHLVSSQERLKAFYEYQVNNPELQSIGCSRKSHEGYKSFLIRAEKTLIKANDKLGRPL